jgi:hypothetical protein
MQFSAKCNSASSENVPAEISSFGSGRNPPFGFWRSSELVRGIAIHLARSLLSFACDP